MATAEPLKRMARPLALSLALWCGLSAGCVGMNAFIAPDQAPAGVPHQIAATWEKRVMWTPDTVHNGRQIPTLAGRLYLFGEEVGFPLVAEGAVEVDLYDDRPAAQGAPSVLVERWLIDEATLRRLKRKDFIGNGYTLVLPSKTIEDHPDLNAVHLTVKFTPRSGAPLFDAGRSIILSLGDVPAGVTLAKAPVTAQQQPVQPAVYQPPQNQPAPVVPVQAVVPPPQAGMVVPPQLPMVPQPQPVVVPPQQPVVLPPSQPVVVPPPPPAVLPPSQPTTTELPPPIIMRPAPGTEAAPSRPPAVQPSEPESPPLRVRITVDKNRD
jgi:hypothetical protein